MNKFTKILKYIVFVIGIITILCILLSGCGKLKCYPKYNPNTGYYGFVCEGDF